MLRWSRSAAALALGLLLSAAPAQARIERAYIGTFTKTGTGQPDVFANKGEGIYLLELDTNTGAMTTRLAVRTPSPGWLVVDGKRGVLYAASNFNRAGAVAAYRIDPASGDLALINQAVTGARDTPVHLALTPDRRFILAASYDDASGSALPIRADGGVGDYTDIVRPEAPKGPSQSSDMPPGNQITSDHQHPHMHSVGADPSGKYAVFDDAGADMVRVFSLSAEGKLAGVSSFLHTPPGAAPRHFVFNAKGTLLYNLMEQNSKVAVSDFDPATGALKLRQVISALPAGYAGSASASELVLGKDGKHLYASNRLRDSIATFTVKPDGSLAFLGDVSSGSSFPRSMAIDPSGRYLVALGEFGDNAVAFRLDPKTGIPRPLNKFAPVPSPVAIAFVDN